MKRLFFALASLAAIACARSHGLELEPLTLDPVGTLPGDTALLARVAHEHPCPRSVPAAWVRADPTLGSGLRCSLVAAAMATLQRTREPAQLVAQIRRLDFGQVACVRLREMAYRERASGKLTLASWSVEFLALGHAGVGVSTDRQTGESRAHVLLDESDESVGRACRPAT